MKQVNQHIISSLNWNTSFDRKENASELQARLSTWSSMRMQREFAEIFDKLCPPDQTWRVGSIELDLGTIDYNELESELSLRIKKQLTEKLIDLIRFSGTSGKNEFEILNEDNSRIGLLRSFLLDGIMPWNHSFAQESADRMMANQLIQNKTAVMEMLWEVGAANENVRKRIAWQFSDPTIIKIIEGLEPNNHAQIVDFSNQVTAIQEKEKIVESSVADLRKNIWHWIFNHLFNERGTVFNRVAFMKSTIGQMAAHYNISKEELLELIERAAEKIKKNVGLSSNFLVTLKVLTEESQLIKRKETTALEQVIDHWHVLEVLFRDSSLRRPESRIAEFNDLVISLFRQDKSRFAELIRSIGNDDDVWTPVLADLGEPAMEIIISSLLPSASGMIVRNIRFLSELGREKNFKVDAEMWWKTGIEFALDNTNATVDAAVFLKYCISEIGKAKQASAEQICSQLLTGEIPPASKTVATLEIYSGLRDIFLFENKKDNTSFLSGEIYECIDALNDQLVSHESDRELFLSLRRSLVNKIQLDPKAVFEILIAYPKKDALGNLLPFLVVGNSAEALLRNSKMELRKVISEMEQVLFVLKKNGNASKLVEVMTEHLSAWALETILMQHDIDSSRLLNFILEALAKELGNSYREQFILLCNELIDNSNSIMGSVAEKMIDRLEAEKLPIVDKGGRNNLAVDGEKWMKILLEEYKTFLFPFLNNIQERELETQLQKLYWKCMLDHAGNKINIATLRKSFHAAVLYCFDVPDKNIFLTEKKRERKKGVALTEKVYKLNNGECVTLRELFELISRCLEDEKTELNKNGKKYELKELLDLGLEQKPSEVRKIISRLPLTNLRLQLLKTTGSFRQLSLWIMSDLRGEINSAMEAMRMLHDMITLLIPDEAVDKFTDEFWVQAWNVIATGTWSREDLKKLIQTSLTKMAMELDINAATFIAEIKKNEIRISPLLKEELVASFPAFSALTENKKERKAGQKLFVFESKGLLDNLVEHLVTQKRIPSWSGDSDEQEVKTLLNEIIIHHPVKFLQVVKREIISESQMRWLSKTIDVRELVRSMGYLNKEKETLLSMLGEFHLEIGKISMPIFSTEMLRGILFTKLMKAWTSNNWRIIAVENIWNEIVWDVCVKHGIQKKDFLRDMKKSAAFFPPAVKIALENVMERELEKSSMPEKKLPEKMKNKIGKKSGATGIPVRNAGIVMLNSYIQMLFERLGIVSEKKFVSPQAQNDSVHYLQYVITGLSKTEESLLPLNKVLCGLPLSHPVHDGITITNDQKKLIEGLIKAVISHWPTIGDTSIDGFRGNWLVRDGMLVEHESNWELTVEKRAYDILLNKSPYSFSIIKYPWMEKPLHVTWPY